MSFIITIICFILILGTTVTIHEFGHFLFAKKAGIYVYEFSIGMGPRLKKFKRKNDETEYSIRLLPIGGYVQMAGEEVEVDEKIPKNKRLQSKTWTERFMTMVAGVLFNFIFAMVVLFIIASINGVNLHATYIAKSNVKGIEVGDNIVAVDGHFVNNYDKLNLELVVASQNKKNFNIKVKHQDGSFDEVKVNLKKVGELTITGKARSRGILASLVYSVSKFLSLIEQMIFTIWYLIIGKISLNMLSGPVGIFNIVGEAASVGITSLLYLLALISINVGFINLLPIPAFDGGHLLFLIIEKIKGSPVNPKVENTIHGIFFVLLMILMLYITFNDILKLF